MKQALIAGLVLLVLLGCCLGAYAGVQLAVTQSVAAAGGDAAADCVFQQTGCVLAVMAQTLEDHVWGPNLNHYAPADLVVQPAYQKWLADCGGSVCSDMSPTVAVREVRRRRLPDGE